VSHHPRPGRSATFSVSPSLFSPVAVVSLTAPPAQIAFILPILTPLPIASLAIHPARPRGPPGERGNLS
jgi:hypothetical protein